MAKTGYGYAERNVDSELNWFEIGQGVSNVIKEEQRLRQEKKDALDKSTREYMNYLSEAPQGINQDVNNFINNFTSDMMKQKLIDVELLKSGRMDPAKFTLRQQNYMDGTKQLYSLQKLYQDNAQKIMDDINSGKVQAGLALYNMKTIEGYKNLNNSRATIDSEGDGRIGIALYENKVIDGKMVRVLSKNMTPVNVVAGQILNQPAYYDVEAATDKSVDAFGDRIGTLYSAATVAKAGTITEFTGVGAMEKYGKQFKSVIDEFNNYLSLQADSMLSDEYNITSVLTENIGKYDSDSFTYDRNEAQADKSKILLKIDPSTTQPIMDDKAPHYEEQKKEAKEWIISNMRSKFDRKTELKTTSQLSPLPSRQPKSATEIDEDRKRAEASAFARQVYNVASGGAQEATNAVKYFQGLFDTLEGKKPKITRTSKGIEIITPENEKIFFEFAPSGKLQNPLEFQRQLISSLNIKDLNEDYIDQELINLNQAKGGAVNKETEAKGYERNIENEIKSKMGVIKEVDFVGKDNAPMVQKLRVLFSAYNRGKKPAEQITLEYGKGVFNDIVIRKKGAPDIEINTNEDLDVAKQHVSNLNNWIRENLDADEFLGKKGSKSSSSNPEQTKGTTQGGNVR